MLVQDQYVDSDVNPVWNYEAHFPVEQHHGLSLQLEVVSSHHKSPRNCHLSKSEILHSSPKIGFHFIGCDLILNCHGLVGLSV